MEEQRNTEEQYDEIDITELLRTLFSNWRSLLKWCGIAAVIGLVIGFSIPKEYTVVSKLAPEIASKSGSSSLSSLASMAGINLNTMSTSDAVYPEIYPEIISSTPFVTDLFSIPVEFKHKKDTVKTDLYDYLDNYTRSPWWSAVLGAPFKLLGLITGGKKEDVGDVGVNPSELTMDQERIAKAINSNISLVVDKKTYGITITVTAQDPHVAAQLSQDVIDRLQRYVTNYRTQKSTEDLNYYQRLFDEAKAVYYTSQQKYAGYVDANQGVVLQRVKTEQERLQNEMDLNYQLYNTCAQQLQMAKAKVQQERPVCAVIDPPTVPLKRSKPSKATILVAFIFLGFCADAVWILWAKDWCAKLKKEPHA